MASDGGASPGLKPFVSSLRLWRKGGVLSATAFTQWRTVPTHQREVLSRHLRPKTCVPTTTGSEEHPILRSASSVCVSVC